MVAFCCHPGKPTTAITTSVAIGDLNNDVRSAMLHSPCKMRHEGPTQDDIVVPCVVIHNNIIMIDTKD